MVSKAQIGEMYWDVNSISQIRDPKKAVKEFEAYLFHLFLKEAFNKETFPSLFGRDFQSAMYRDFFSMELSKLLSEKDPLNLEPLFEKALKAYRRVGGDEG
ncbi:flagellar biosynthesis protein FlgJ [Thermovibrio sp.]